MVRHPELELAIGTDRSHEQRRRHIDELGALLAKMERFGNQRADPVRTIQGYLGDRWSSLVMHLLSGGMLRFNELKQLIGLLSAEGDISHRQLTLKLRTLERDGLVVRLVTEHVPPRVEYRLTPLGRGAYTHFAALVAWTERSAAAIRAARVDYDHSHGEEAALQAEADAA